MSATQMNPYLKLHREMLRLYESTTDWPSEDVRRCTHALAWTLYSIGAAHPGDQPAIMKYLKRAMSELELARATAENISQHRNGG